jgi:hypothetical protein
MVALFLAAIVLKGSVYTVFANSPGPPTQELRVTWWETQVNPQMGVKAQSRLCDSG